MKLYLNVLDPAKAFKNTNKMHVLLTISYHRKSDMIHQEISIGHDKIFVVRRAWWSRKLGQEPNDIATFSKIKQNNSQENHERTLIGES